MTGLGSVARRVSPVVALAALLVTLLGACGPISAVIDTQQALTNAGYQSVSVNFSVSNGDEVKVSVTVNALPSQTNADDVARTVWQKFHERFDFIAVTVHGSGPAFSRDYSYSDLVTLFGPRNPAYDRTSITSATQQLGLIVIIVVVVLIAGAGVTAVLVRRRRRGRRPPPSPPGTPPWMQGGAPAGGPQPPASYPMWPPPQGPPPGRPPQSAPAGSPPGPEPATAWPPAPPPPSGNG